MMPSRKRIVGALVLALTVATPFAADAHRQWLLPSATVLSGKDPWVTIDAAGSNDLFYFEHRPLRLDNLVLTGPDGRTIAPENMSTGRFRNTFDVRLSQPGTYNFAVLNRGFSASWKVDGQTRRWRGTADELAKEVPADATDLQVTEAYSRVESFATVGKPTLGALKPSGTGLEMEPITHPNDLVANQPAEFRLLLDGKPAAGLDVEIVRGGIRYRDKLGETTVKTDADGKFTFTWPEAGMYWLEASVTDDKTSLKQATRRRAMWSATLEALPG